MRTSICLPVVLLILMFLPSVVYPQGNEKRPKIGVVLSGGGAKGFAHIGALKVLVEAGVPIDYIGGTSMGGIMGGLFALGYSPDSLEKLVLSQNWMAVLSDEISRRELSMKEKEQDEKYFFTLPIRDKKIQLPAGLVAGQSVFNILSYYGSPAADYTNFSDFPIPFLCIAADIETGESVILNKGHLPKAMRATMAIPTVFSPIEIDGRLLVDGGLVNNFPVQEVLDMGADFIIGIDVQGKYATKEELNSFVKILDQSTAFLRRPLYEKGLELTDLYIKPDMTNFGVSSFTSADTIIKLGEFAAREMLPEIQKLLEELKHYDDFEPYNMEPAKPLESILIQEVVIQGIKKVAPTFVNSHLQIDVPSHIDVKTVIQNIEMLYATKSFNYIYYDLTPLERGGYRLTLQVSEKTGADLSVGINYNTDLQAAFLLNATFRNLAFPNDRLSLSLDLGDNSGFDADYLIDRGWKPGIGINIKAFSLDAPLFEGSDKVASFDFSSLVSQLYTQSNVSTRSTLRGGMELEYADMRSDIFAFDVENYKEWNLNFFLNFKLDDLDRKTYPQYGRNFFGEMKLVTNVNDTLGQKADPLLFANVRFLQAIPLRNKFTLLPQFNGGSLLSYGDATLPKYQSYLGGLTEKYGNGIFPFVGLEFMQIKANHTLSGRIDLRYEVLNNVFATAKWNLGFYSEYLSDLLSENGVVNGYGISLGVKTPIGPIEVSAMHSDYSGKWLGYFNLGYRF
ncbi:MAG: patatin-like phospholipase family protein [Bacteroidales bacterium]|nr:patatin-like phospholipase family protein [Bacteroidales bacterium]